MLTITGKASHCTVNEVKPTLLDTGKIYATVEIVRDSSGEDTLISDMCFVYMADKIKCLRFVSTGKQKGLVDVPAVHFYGPIGIEPCE